MANDTLENILNISAADGPFSVGDAVLEQTLRDFIQLQSNTIAIATDLVGVRSVPWLEFKWYTGVQGTFSYPLDDAATVDPTKIGTSNYTVKLQKGQGRCVFLDTVRLRGESFENIDRQQLQQQHSNTCVESHQKVSWPELRLIKNKNICTGWV